MRCALAQEGHTCEKCYQRNCCQIYAAYKESLQTLRKIGSMVT